MSMNELSDEWKNKAGGMHKHIRTQSLTGLSVYHEQHPLKYTERGIRVEWTNKKEIMVIKKDSNIIHFIWSCNRKFIHMYSILI